jgi:hypothetical protein
MRFFDVFNGDADGICALRQLRLAEPVESTLATGLKRDIELLKDVPAQRGDRVTVLDISLDRNREALMQMLARGVQVRYFDHHYAGPIPKHPDLIALIDESGELCTSALVDRHLLGRFRAWAVAGAFGDNLPETALELAHTLELDAEKVELLRELGASLNYNAYGDTLADVLVAPADLYRAVSRYDDPVELVERDPLIARLTQERVADLHRALGSPPARSSGGAVAYVLPDAPWSRRVSGTFANRLSLADPKRAHAVLTPAAGGAYSVSIRSPRGKGLSAVDFCRRFATGGGRALAAGIDRLEGDRLDRFLDEFALAWRDDG